MVAAFRASAARDVLFRAGFLGLCAKRSGRGVLTDLMVRTVVCEGFGIVAAESGIRGTKERVDDRESNEGGKQPQLRGALGGIVAVVTELMGRGRDGSWRFLGWILARAWRAIHPLIFGHVHTREGGRLLPHTCILCDFGFGNDCIEFVTI